MKLYVDTSVKDSRRRWELTLVGKNADRSCWFEADDSFLQPSTLDFALAAGVHRAMSDGQDLHLSGTASFKMLANLEHYIEIWSSWRPDIYKPIGLSADDVDMTAHTGPLARPGAVMAFSGGLDSSATLIRQIENLAKRSTVEVQMLMLVQGFDLPVGASAAFERARAAIMRQVEQFHLPISVVATNWRQSFEKDWEMEFISALSACLHLHSARYSVGSFAADEAYATLKDYLPWGNNPLSNHYLSGGLFEIREDAAALSRCAKAELVARYPQIRDNLRVCWAGPMTGENCGRCEKCMRTQLNFIARGLSPSAAFPSALAAADVSKIAPTNILQCLYIEEICAEADNAGVIDDRIEVLRSIAHTARQREPNPPRVQELRNLRHDSAFDALKKTTEQFCNGREVIFVPNTGNWGDALINLGAVQFLDHIGVKFKIAQRRQIEAAASSFSSYVFKDSVLITPGAGNWCKNWPNAQKFVQAVSSAFYHVLVFPTTFELGTINNTKENISYFRRDDLESLQTITNSQFCHDMSFFIEGRIYASAERIAIGNFFRLDNERHPVRRHPANNIDLSSVGNESTDVEIFFNIISAYETIRTDRLHVAIAGAMMGRKVELYPGNYWKSAAVFRSSLWQNYANVSLRNWENEAPHSP